MTLLAIAAIWLALFCWTGDRRLLFPFTIACAAEAGLMLRARLRWPMLTGGVVVMAVFTAIRVFQRASFDVLLVELAVAAAILTFTAAIARRTTPFVPVAFASLLAYIGLAL
mgnify:CR=1 FL=1